MKIAMFTNTYQPHVGGVARSVQTLEDSCRRRGHEVRVIAPESDEAEPSPHVLRVPAIQHFNGSDFSVRLPFQNVISGFMDDFQPDIIHSHHPFLLGDSALRLAWKEQRPLVFTHHTLYEQYTHYVPLDSPALKRVTIQLATEYGNRCDLVIAPSASILILLRERDVTSPIEVIPTGINTRFFAGGKGPRFRERHHLPQSATVIGHVGRLAEEKNLLFLAEATALVLAADPDIHFLIVGQGPALDAMRAILGQGGHAPRIHPVGTQTGPDLADAYAAMDCFVFASQSETQGLVIAEAMAAGKPVVALDAPGVREILRDHKNGRMLPTSATAAEFAAALGDLLKDRDLLLTCARNARIDATAYDTDRCVNKILECYEELLSRPRFAGKLDPSPWDRFLAGIQIEWDMLAEKTAAVAAAVIDWPATKSNLK